MSVPGRPLPGDLLLTAVADPTNPLAGLFFDIDQTGFSGQLSIQVQPAPLAPTPALLALGLLALWRWRHRWQPAI